MIKHLREIKLHVPGVNRGYKRASLLKTITQNQKNHLISLCKQHKVGYTLKIIDNLTISQYQQIQNIIVYKLDVRR